MLIVTCQLDSIAVVQQKLTNTQVFGPKFQFTRTTRKEDKVKRYHKKTKAEDGTWYTTTGLVQSLQSVTVMEKKAGVGGGTP